MGRDVTHFEHLGRLLNLERQEEKDRLGAERKALSLQERQARGLTLLDVEAKEEDLGLGGRVLVTLERADRARLPVKLWSGDLVEVRPRKAEVSEPARAVVSRGTPTTVQLAFDRAPPPWVSDGRLVLDIVPNDVSFERARTALRRMAARDKGVERHCREVLLGNTPPRFEREAPWTPSRTLNPEQQAAVSRALSARDFLLVHGPPGTGKSHVLAEVAVQAARTGARILCTAASNAAVDHLLELCLDAGLSCVRVGHPARISPRLQEHSLDALVEAHPDRVLSRELFDEGFALLGYARRQRTQGRSRERFQNAREGKAEAYKLFDEARALERKAVDAVLSRAQVVCATCTALEGSTVSSLQFDLCLFDEATQATEPVSLIPWLRSERVVMAGDPFQLPPTVLSERAAKEGLSRSLFERLLQDHGDPVKQLLREQHRMSEALMAFTSATTYGGELRAHPAVAQRTLAEVLRPGVDVEAPPFLFLDTAGKGLDEETEENGESLLNRGEAELLVARARVLLEAGLPPEGLALITPYAAQARLLRELLPDPAVEVDTVDAFQGREKDAVLLSFVRSNGGQQLGFLKDLRRLNVALTRPRRHLFAVGDSATLTGHATYGALVDHAHATSAWRSAWEWNTT
ncbi:MAG: AAA family ATPase [Deltaproteobacteria bacterium]|nr:AAA family ATPase [Deltaproteobacteria bacterium]